MGWAIIENDESDTWFRVFQSVRNYMFIMRLGKEELYNTKMNEALSTYENEEIVTGRRKDIRRRFEIISLISDRVFNKLTYDLNYH